MVCETSQDKRNIFQPDSFSKDLVEKIQYRLRLNPDYEDFYQPIDPKRMKMLRNFFKNSFAK